MPQIISIISLADGFLITPTKGAPITFTSADLTPAQKLMTPSQLEAIGRTFLANRIPDNMVADIHLTSVVPLLGAVIIGNADYVIPPNWWVAG